MSEVRRRTDYGYLAECPMCASLDIGATYSNVHCYGCDLNINRPTTDEAVAAWNTRGGKPLPPPPEQESE